MVEITESEEPAITVSLFERSTLHEWEASLPTAGGLKESSWSSIRPNVGQFLRLFGAKSLPESLLFIIEQALRWKVAYSTVHYSIAIQKDGSLEIWRDYCSVPVAKCRILDDEHPQWCKLQWSASGNLLLSARSMGAVDAYDGTGAFCFSIPIPSPEGSFNPLYSVASIASVAYTTDTAWSDRIWILQYDGNIRYFLAGRVSGYHPLSVINVSGGPSSIAVTASLLPRANAILIAFHDPDSSTSSDTQSIANRGISMWRIIDTEPYLERFGMITNALEANTGNVQKKSFTLFQAAKEYGLQIVVNTDENSAACLTSRGDVVAFRVPSLQIIKIWALGDELSWRRPNASFITGIGCWSQKELMLLYSTGFVATVNFDSDGTTSAVEKNYNSWAQLICAAQGHVMVLEITDCPRVAVVQSKTWSSLVWPLVRIPYVLLQLAAQAFVGAPLTAGDASDQNAETVPCRYVLHEMKAITPPELFNKKLIANNYEEALSVAETYCLNADRVYQEQWRKNPVTVESIDSFLVKVKLDKWIIDECLNQLPSSLEACRKLLKLGLTLTENLSTLTTEKEIQLKQQDCSSRYRLIHYLRILEDYEAMLEAGSGRSAQFDARYYGDVRNLSLYEWSLKLARATDFERLNVLFSKYGRRLFSIWLLLLSNVPEIVDLGEYEFLLPKRGERPDWAKRKIAEQCDFIEDERFVKVVDRKSDDVEILVRDKAPLRKFILSIDSSSKDESILIKDWYEFRSIEIEQYSCLPDLAEKFLLAAAANGFSDLGALREDMGLLRFLNYDCSLTNSVSYDRLKKMPPLETMLLLLKEAPKEIFIQRFEQWAVPFCLRLEKRNEAIAKTLVWKYLVSASEESLKIPLLLCQSFKTKSDWWSKTIGLTETDVIRMAADCLTACGGTNQIDAGFQLIAYIPEPADDDEEDAELVTNLENHLTALHLLNVYGIGLSYKKLQDVAANGQESAMLLKRLVRYGTTSSLLMPKTKKIGEQTIGGRVWTTDDWQTLLKDMIKISRTVLPSIGEQRCRELFVDGLLSSKSTELINLASKFFATTRSSVGQQQQQKKEKVESQLLTYDSAAELISQAAEAYVNEAIDARDESLSFARKCLTVLENPPDKLIRELEFIDALPILEYFDVREMPARLKLYKSPIRLIEEIFTRKPTAYEDYGKLSKLCKLLRVPIVDRNEAKNLLIMCTKQALLRGDGSACVKFCKEIESSGCACGWRVCCDACTELCTTSHFNSDVRYRLLTFCLRHCDDAGQLESILRCSQGLKVELLKKSLIDSSKPSEMEPRTAGAIWNEIKAKSKIDRVSNWRMDLIYFDPGNYRKENESQSFDEQGVSIFNFLRYILLNEETDRELFDDVLAAIGTTTAGTHTHLAAVALAGIKDDDKRERALKSIPQSALAAKMAVYVNSFRKALRNSKVDKVKVD